VELSDGVGELEAAALFEVYSYSQAALTRAVSRTGTVRTMHGLTLVTELTGSAATLQAPDGQGTAALDRAFEQLATTVSPGVVESVSKMLEYPLDRVSRDVTPGAQQWRAPALLALSLILAMGLGLLPRLLRRRRA
jgi:hypothetical protein